MYAVHAVGGPAFNPHGNRGFVSAAGKLPHVRSLVLRNDGIGVAPMKVLRRKISNIGHSYNAPPPSQKISARNINGGRSWGSPPADKTTMTSTATGCVAITPGRVRCPACAP